MLIQVILKMNTTASSNCYNKVVFARFLLYQPHVQVGPTNGVDIDVKQQAKQCYSDTIGTWQESRHIGKHLHPIEISPTNSPEYECMGGRCARDNYVQSNTTPYAHPLPLAQANTTPLRWDFDSILLIKM
jgi:hypothetical protein